MVETKQTVKLIIVEITKVMAEIIMQVTVADLHVEDSNLKDRRYANRQEDCQHNQRNTQNVRHCYYINSLYCN